MNIWYQSEKMFTKKIMKKWQRRQVKFNAGNVNILKYAYRTSLLHAEIKGQKISQTNGNKINLTLF